MRCGAVNLNDASSGDFANVEGSLFRDTQDRARLEGGSGEGEFTSATDAAFNNGARIDIEGAFASKGEGCITAEDGVFVELPRFADFTLAPIGVKALGDVAF